MPFKPFAIIAATVLIPFLLRSSIKAITLGYVSVAISQSEIYQRIQSRVLLLASVTLLVKVNCGSADPPGVGSLDHIGSNVFWNDYFWSLILIQSDRVRPVTAGLSSLKGQWLAAWELISAGSIIVALPPIIMFFLLQKHFIAELTLGATKD